MTDYGPKQASRTGGTRGRATASRRQFLRSSLLLVGAEGEVAFALADVAEGVQDPHATGVVGEAVSPDMMAWAEAGALNVLTVDDRYWGVTGIVRIVDWIRKHPEKGVWLNLHKNASYVNRMVTAAVEPEIAPWLELTGGHVKDGRQSIPDWIGISRFDWDYIDKNRL